MLLGIIKVGRKYKQENCFTKRKD